MAALGNDKIRGSCRKDHLASCFLIFGALAMPPCLTILAHAQNPSPTVVTIHVTDFGINQPWNAQMQPGDVVQAGSAGKSFSGLNSAFPWLDGLHILEPMQSDSDLDKYSSQTLAERDAHTLAKQIDGGLKYGSREFEVQMVENINLGGYADLSPLDVRQQRVDASGQASYAALGGVVKNLEAEGYVVKVDLVLGSNGTKAFAASVDSWKPYASNITRVDLIDGRAYIRPMSNAIDALGRNGEYKVRIFNTVNDVPAPPGSLGNSDTSKELMKMHPGISVYRLTDKSSFPDASLGSAHIASAIDHNDRFYVEKWTGTAYRPLPNLMTTRDLRNVSSLETQTVSRTSIPTAKTYPLQGQNSHEYKPPPNTSLKFNPSAPTLYDNETVKRPPSVNLPAPTPPRPEPSVLSSNPPEGKPPLSVIPLSTPPRGGVCMTSTYEVKADSDFGDGSPQQTPDTHTQAPAPATPDCTSQQKK